MLDAERRPELRGRRGRRASTAPSAGGRCRSTAGAGSRDGSTRSAGTVSVARFDGEATEPAESTRASARGPRPGGTPGPVLLGAERREPGGPAESHLDGKLEAPSVAGPATGRWASSCGPGRPRLRAAASTARCAAVTGRRWSGDVHDWRCAPEQYAAMHFHADAVDDLGWEPTFELELPGELETGVYAVVLSAAGNEDLVPFVVRADGAARDGRAAAELHLSRLLLRARRARGRGLDRARGPLGRAQPAERAVRPPRGRGRRLRGEPAEAAHPAAPRLSLRAARRPPRARPGPAAARLPRAARDRVRGAHRPRPARRGRRRRSPAGGR